MHQMPRQPVDMAGAGFAVAGILCTVVGFLLVIGAFHAPPLIVLAVALAGIGCGLNPDGAFTVCAAFGIAIFGLVIGFGANPVLGLVTIAAGVAGCVGSYHFSGNRKGLFGSSRWAAVSDLKKAGMTQPGGLFLGTLDGRDIYQHGEDSVLTAAPQGAGKSSCLAIPTLLTYPGSVIVTDPKGELAQHTAAVRRSMRQRVIILNPFRRTLTALSGVDLGDDGFNPLSLFPPGHGMSETAEMLARIISPEKPKEDDFFAPASRDVLAALLYYVLITCKGPDRSIAHARTLLLQAPSEFRGMLENEWLGSDDENLVQYAGTILGDMEGDEQWAGIRRGAVNALSIYKDDLAQHISRGDIPPDLFKQVAVSVYIILPGDKTDSHGAWFRLVASVLCQAVGRPGPAYQVLFLCDEFANLGPAHSILKSVALYRSAGLKAWLLVQNLGQLKRLYDEGWTEILSLCRTKQFFKVAQGDKETAVLVSEATGDMTALNPSWNPEQQARSIGQTGVPLIRPEDVPRLPDGEQIIFSGNLPAIKAKLVSFRSRRDWSASTVAGAAKASRSAKAGPFVSDRELAAGLLSVIAGGFVGWLIATAQGVAMSDFHLFGGAFAGVCLAAVWSARRKP